MNESNPAAKRPWRRTIRRAALLLGLAALALGGALIYNALQMKSKQIKTKPADTIELDADALAALLGRFVAVPSVSYPDRSRMDPSAFRQLHAILQSSFPKAHEVLERETVNELSLLYCWPGKDPSLAPILVMSHLDVVPVESSSLDQWKHPPERGVVAEGFVWGRGALDVKSGVIAIMGAVEHLAGRGFAPERTIYLAFGHDEEVGGQEGNAAIARLLGDRLPAGDQRLSYVLDEGGAILDGVIPGAPRPVAFVAIAEKPTAIFSVVARGEGGHGSMRGRSAISNLAEAIVRLDKNPPPIRMPQATLTLLDYLGPEMPFLQRVVLGNRWLFRGLVGRRFAQSPSTAAVVRSTLNFTQIGTQTATNQNAALATATINARLLPGDTAEDLLAYIMQVTDDMRTKDGRRAIACTLAQPPDVAATSPVDCAEFLALQRTIHEVFPEVIVAPGLTAVGTDSRWYYDLTKHVYRFIPMRFQPDDLARLHGIDERISVQNLGEVARFYVQLIKNTAGGAE